MAQLTKADAARQLGIARSTLYKLIDQGKMSATPDGTIDSTELVRVAAYVDALHERTRTSAHTDAMDAHIQGETLHGCLQTAVREQGQTGENGRPQTSSDVLVDILREQLQILRDELQEARQNAQAAREREALLLQMLQQMHHRYDRLLDAPRPAPAVELPTVPVVSQKVTLSPTAAEDVDRGTMRRRILALLQDHPEGLTPAEIRRTLQVDKPMGHTCIAMRRDGLLRRVEQGRYTVA